MEGNDQPDKRADDLLKDDASIEILSQSGDSRTRDSEWSIYSPGRSSITGSEMSLMDFQKVSSHSKMATIVHRDGRQFIERRDLDDGGLPYSAEFYLNGEVWKLNGEDCLLMSARRYLAMVTVEGTVDLDGALGFEEAVRTLLKYLKVEKVVVDKELEECNKTESVLVTTLDKLIVESGENIDRKRDVMLLRMLLKKHGNSLNMDFKHDLRNCSQISSEIMSPLDNYVTKTLKLIQRNEILGHLNGSSLSDEFVSDSIQEALNCHRARLTTICPSSMKDKLKQLSDDRILYITMDDMHLFADLTTLDEAIFESVLPMIFSKYLTRVQEIMDEQFAAPDPLTNRIFLYVCKSLQEVAEQLGALIKTDNAIIYSEALGWKVTNLQEESQTPYSKCLRQQLHMLAKLANHFEPGGPFRTSRFPYKFELFQNVDAVPEPVRIWLCLLDDCMKDRLQADLDKMQMLSCFFKSYVSFIASEDFRSETLECLRTITHDALRSLAIATSPRHDLTTPDAASLEYNQMISCCLDKSLREHFGNECVQIETTLQRIIRKALDMNAASDELSKFSNSFKRLLNDLSDLQLEWFIQLTPSHKRSLLLRSKFIVPVDSKWKDTEGECYKVVDLEGFVEMYKLLHNSEELPKHHQLEVIQELLKNLGNLTSKQSSKAENLLDAMTAMTNSIIISLVHLKEQPDDCRFEDVLPKMSKPCDQAIEEDLQDLPSADAIDSQEMLDPLPERFEESIFSFFISFNKHITETAQLSREERIGKIVSDVRSKIEPKLATSWTEEFKRNELPDILAGLSAVWSIIGCKTSSEMMMQPSHLQISCILSIFGVRENHSIDHSHQLMQISTQQGKELVLGLMAALLALYGHNVHIVCFNSDLTRMNSMDWIEVFKRFSILSNVSYESLKDLAIEGSKGVYEKYTTYINECFGFETNAKNDNEPKNASEDERSVLLIEDIDIILQENTMTRPIKRFVRPTIPGLEKVQERLFWHGTDVANVWLRDHIDRPEMKEFRAFIDRHCWYTLLEGNPIEKVEYTNKSLFLKHFKVMQEAKTMKAYSSGYDKLGYLSLGYIPFPYSNLLKSFPLVLGFASASLDTIGEYLLNHYYGICRSISDPNLFQTIATKFDSKKDFLYLDSKYEWYWSESVAVAIKTAIDRNCLVLVFFKDALQRQQVQCNQRLKQLNVTAIITENPSSDHDFSETEICVLTVCNGNFSKDRQVHVIQTFFSKDRKEEDLIRRQAERSHSSGSYELIIPEIPIEHGKNERITYNSLVNKRQYTPAEDIKRDLAMNIEQHNKVKRFLKL